MRKLSVFAVLILMSTLLTACYVPNIGRMFFRPDKQYWVFDDGYTYALYWLDDGNGALDLFYGEKCPWDEEIQFGGLVEAGITFEDLFGKYLFTSAEVVLDPVTSIRYTRGDSVISETVQICEFRPESESTQAMKNGLLALMKWLELTPDEE